MTWRGGLSTFVGVSGLTSLPVHRSPLEIASLLEERVLSGQLSAGDRLPSERQLALDYGVSRPVLREALGILRERRLIQVLPGRGTFITQPTVAQIAAPMELLYRRQDPTPREVIEARLMLECEAARLAARHATLDEVQELARRLEALERSRSALERVRWDLAFHFLVAAASHNSLIEAMFASISRLSIELMLISATNPDMGRNNDSLHMTVCEAIRARDPEAAAASMKAHLTVSPRAFGPDYERPLEAIAVRGMRSLGYEDLEAFLNDAATVDGLAGNRGESALSQVSRPAAG